MGRTSTSARRNQIMQLIIEKGKVINSELAKEFGVTSETIRKDIIYLEKEGLLEKQHGRASRFHTVNDSPLLLRSNYKSDEKEAIARKATEFIKNGDVIYMDGGSTVLALANLLGSFENLTVITNSLSVANSVLKQGNTVYLVGGFVDPTTQITCGPGSVESVRSFRPSLSFMGTNGIKFHTGPTTADYNNVELKSAVLEVCATNVILCDSSKFESGSVTQYAPWSSCRYLITDSDVPARIKETMPETMIVIA